MVTREVILSYRQNDPKAQEAVITEYFPLVRKIAYTQRRNHARGLDISDMIQEGLSALNEAVLRYDLDSEYLLDVLASVCIKRRIISYIRKQHSGYNIWNTVSLDLCINEEENLFLSDVIRLIYMFLHDLGRQILLIHPVVGVVMAVLISHSLAEL